MHYFRSFVLLFILSVLFFAAGAWTIPLIDRDEPRFAEASREMRARADYIIPYFNNNYRFDKPPLIYWCQIACYKFLGENDFAARLPSVLAAAGTVLLVYGFGRRLGGTDVGWSAALIFLTTYQVSEHAKAAVADMAMIFFFTLSTWTGWEMLRHGLTQRERWKWWALFYGSLALGFLAKGPVAWLPLIVVGIFSAIQKPDTASAGKGESSDGAKWLRLVLGLLLMLALVGAWGIPALKLTNGEFLKVGIGKHVIGRSFSAMEGHGTGGAWGYVALLPLYFVTVFLTFFPWSIRLPWLVSRLRRNATDLRKDQRYLLLGIILVFAVFTLARTKLPHYTLPAFPMMAILLAQELHAAKLGESIARWAKVTLLVFTALLLFVTPLLMRQFPWFFPGHALIQQSAAVLRPEMEFASCDYQEPSLVWYARGHVNGWYTPLKTPRKLAEFMQKPGPRFCVAPADTLQPAPDWLVFSTPSLNFVKFKQAPLQLMVKQR